MSVAVTCSCGSKFKAKEELAGKRVKCPSCGGTLAVPAVNPAVLDAGDPLGAVDPPDDPLGLGDLASDPLFSGDADGDPLGLNGKAPLPRAASATAAPQSTQTAKKGEKRSGSQLVTAAGWVAVAFGGYQILIQALHLLWIAIAVVRAGSLVLALGFGTVLSVLFLGLGVWLVQSGFQIVQGVAVRESLERAAQASMVFVALAILSVIISVFSIMRAPALTLLVIRGLAEGLVYLFPPAFILYVDKTTPS